MELMKAQLAAAKKPVKLPEIAVPPPAAPPPPPPSQSSADVLAAEQSARKQAGGRSGYSRTLFAGASPGALGGQRTLLG